MLKPSVLLYLVSTVICAVLLFTYEYYVAFIPKPMMFSVGTLAAWLTLLFAHKPGKYFKLLTMSLLTGCFAGLAYGLIMFQSALSVLALLYLLILISCASSLSMVHHQPIGFNQILKRMWEIVLLTIIASIISSIIIFLVVELRLREQWILNAYTDVFYIAIALYLARWLYCVSPPLFHINEKLISGLWSVIIVLAIGFLSYESVGVVVQITGDYDRLNNPFSLIAIVLFVSVLFVYLAWVANAITTLPGWMRLNYLLTALFVMGMFCLGVIKLYFPLIKPHLPASLRTITDPARTGPVSLPLTLKRFGLQWGYTANHPLVFGLRDAKAISACQMVYHASSRSVHKSASYVEARARIPWVGGELYADTCYAYILGTVQASKQYQVLNGIAKLRWSKSSNLPRNAIAIKDWNGRRFCKASVNHKDYLGLYVPAQTPDCRHGLCAQVIVNAYCRVIVNGKPMNANRFVLAYLHYAQSIV